MIVIKKMQEKPYVHSIYYSMDSLYPTKKNENSVTPEEFLDYIKFNAKPEVPSSLVCFS